MILAPRRKWHWGTSSFKPRETKIFPLTSASLFRHWSTNYLCENIHSQFMFQGHNAKSVYTNSSVFWSLQTQGLSSPWRVSRRRRTDSIPWLTLSFSHTPSLHLTFLIFLSSPSFSLSLSPYILSSFQFLRLNSISGEWENEQNKACGGLRIIWNWETESLWRSQLDI